METGQRYAKLLDIAKETSSERRRELLNEVTDLFFDNQSTVTQMESNMFGELLAKVAFNLDAEVRRELSTRFEHSDAPRPLAFALANDEIEVASPILRNSKSLTDDDLVKIVETKGTQYQLAVSQRIEVSELVSNALVDHGNDEVLGSLLRNEGAKISADTYDKVVVRAENNEALHQPLVHRKSVPPDVLNQLYLIVSGPMRQEILEKNKNFTQAEIEEAMKRAEMRVGMQVGVLPPDYEEANRKMLSMKACGGIIPAQLPNIWRNGEFTLFLLVFGEITNVPYLTIAKMVDKKDVDGIAILCRAKDFPRALFVTIAVLALGEEGMSQAEVLGHMYNDVPQEAANRALRFMQVRNAAAKAA